jgi:predicted metalloprotease
MKLDGRRESNNVEDRRGQRSALGGIGKIGIGGIVVMALITWAMGGNPLDVLQNVDPSALGQVTEQPAEGRQFTAEEEEMAKFSRQILASTEDVWSEIFKENGMAYETPKMVLYTGGTQTACGNGSAAMGPFYCSADQSLYIDLSFFTEMKRTLGADGDFAYAYVIAHEVGHHVEYLLGTLGKAHDQMSRMNKTDANKISVRLELLADFYAGVWANRDNKKYSSLEDGDLEEAINCAEKIGDNYLQEKAQGYSQPESFTHGTSQQRMKWLKLGLQTGDIHRGTTFQVTEAEL